jgi:hypothetical protein
MVSLFLLSIYANLLYSLKKGSDIGLVVGYPISLNKVYKTVNHDKLSKLNAKRNSILTESKKVHT